MTPVTPLEDDVTLVVGMHRSGTSALARTLNLLGLAMPRNLIAPNAFNETGYWESESFMTFNNRLLDAQDRHWSDPKPLGKNWEDLPTFQADCTQAAHVLHSAFDQPTGTVLKDPRVSRTLPVWRKALETVGVSPVCLIAYRHPQEVVQSLARRNAMTEDHALKLWQTYMIEAEKNTRGLRRAVIQYDRFLEDWRSELRRALESCGAPCAIDRLPNQSKIDAYISPNYRHHTLAPDARPEDGLKTSGIGELFALFRSGDIDSHAADFDRLEANWRTDWAQKSPGPARSELPETIAEWHLELSRSLIAAGQETEAADAARRAVDLDPDKSGYWYALGKRLFALKRHQEAAEAFGQATHLEDSLSIYQENLAITFLKLGRLDQALRAIHTALTLEPDRAELHSIEGGILMEKDLPERAIHSYVDAISLKYNVAQYHFGMGNALLHAGKIDVATASFETALRLDPIYAPCLMKLGELHRNKGRLSCAEEMFRRALTCHEEPPLPAQALADVLHRQCRNDDAIEVLQGVLRNETECGYIYETIGRLLATQRRLTEAEDAFARCRALDRKPFIDPRGQNDPGEIAVRAVKTLCSGRPVDIISEQRCDRILAAPTAEWWARDLIGVIENTRMVASTQEPRWPVGKQSVEPECVPIAPRAAGADRCCISIMIPVYEVGRESWLRDCIESILAQDRGAHWGEIVVVDDCSASDTAAKIVREYAPRVQYRRHAKNLGLIGNHNYCLDIARGDFIHFVHQDDRIEPGFYDGVLDPLIAQDTLVAAFSSWQFIDEDGQLTNPWPRETSQPGVRENLVHALGLYSWMTFPSGIVRRASYEKIGGFSPSFAFAFDVDIWSRLAVLGPVWSEPLPLAHFRSHMGSATHRFSEFDRLTDRMAVRESTLAHLPPDVRYATALASLDFLFRFSWRTIMSRSITLSEEDVTKTLELLTRGWTSVDQRREIEDTVHSWRASKA